jgi:hypothetical protein
MPGKAVARGALGQIFAGELARVGRGVRKLVVGHEHDQRQPLNAGLVHRLVKSAGRSAAVAEAGRPDRAREALHPAGEEDTVNHGDHGAEVADHGQYALGNPAAVNVAVAGAHGTERGTEKGAESLKGRFAEGQPPRRVPDQGREDIPGPQVQPGRRAECLLPAAQEASTVDLPAAVQAGVFVIQNPGQQHHAMGLPKPLGQVIRHGRRRVSQRGLNHVARLRAAAKGRQCFFRAGPRLTHQPVARLALRAVMPCRAARAHWPRPGQGDHLGLITLRELAGPLLHCLFPPLDTGRLVPSIRAVRCGVFVYRLGHGPLKAERWVRFPYALPLPINGLHKSASERQVKPARWLGANKPVLQTVWRNIRPPEEQPPSTFSAHPGYNSACPHRPGDFLLGACFLLRTCGTRRTVFLGLGDPVASPFDELFLQHEAVIG